MEVTLEEILFKNIEIWFQDEARIRQRGTVTRIWTCLYFWSCLSKEKSAVELIMPTVGTDFWMQLHLDEIGRQIEPRNHTVVVFDCLANHKKAPLG